MISCVVNPDSECVACRLATRDGPTSKNYRGNPSLMIRYRGAAEVKDAEEEGGGTSGHRNIIIDCGKTFKASVLRFFPGIKERHIDALVITHGLRLHPYLLYLLYLLYRFLQDPLERSYRGSR
ncbi:hypothetical protein T484DRAFT_1746780 [Baffinella frigidus]|nr:hypothetical protein T484DRAFT_1746780 [Cryptophyta sp. CCMP2293]